MWRKVPTDENRNAFDLIYSFLPNASQLWWLLIHIRFPITRHANLNCKTFCHHHGWCNCNGLTTFLHWRIFISSNQSRRDMSPQPNNNSFLQAKIYTTSYGKKYIIIVIAHRFHTVFKCIRLCFYEYKVTVCCCYRCYYCFYLTSFIWLIPFFIRSSCAIERKIMINTQVEWTARHKLDIQYHRVFHFKSSEYEYFCIKFSSLHLALRCICNQAYSPNRHMHRTHFLGI